MIVIEVFCAIQNLLQHVYILNLYIYSYTCNYKICVALSEYVLFHKHYSLPEFLNQVYKYHKYAKLLLYMYTHL